MIISGLIIEFPDREPTPVPLTGVSVTARIIDLVAEVTIEQRYVNRENQPIEAVYLFPLDEGAGVCKFTAEVDGRNIEGIVKETEEARTDYEHAIQSGHSAFLVEEKLPDVFKAKVGNLAAGSGAKIRLTYVTELKVEGGEIRFYLPTTIAPRYVPPTDHSSVAKDLAGINYTPDSQYKIDFNATVRMGSAIKEIRSPTHKIAVSHDAVNKPMNGALKLDNVVTSMDRDLVVYIQVAEPNEPRLIHEKSANGSSAVMLSLVPSFKLAEQKTELTFLVDRSGSMQGAGIEQARQALKLFLHSLPMDCYVNIAGFGFTYEELFPSSRKYDEVVLNNAKAYAEQLQANLGGTEIYHPLEQIFQKPPIDGYLRQVFVLTDGEVSNADQVLGLVRRHSGRTRVFALGLGSSASHHLVEGMARAGNGTALFASLEERLEKKVMQQLQDALQPALTDIKINWEGYEEKEEPSTTQPIQTEMTLMGYGKPLEEPEAAVPTEKPEMKLRQAPCDKMIPPVFDGRHFIVYALLADDAHQPKWAEVIAVSPVGPLSLKVHLNEHNSEEGQLVHCLAAKKLIQLLQDREENNGDVKKEIIQLGCRYGLASKYTSYVAIDPKEQKELKESWMVMKSRDIPVQVAHGWGGGGSRMRRCTPIGIPIGIPASAPRMMKKASVPMPLFAESLCFDLASSPAPPPLPEMVLAQSGAQSGWIRPSPNMMMKKALAPMPVFEEQCFVSASSPAPPPLPEMILAESGAQSGWTRPNMMNKAMARSAQVDSMNAPSYDPSLSSQSSQDEPKTDDDKLMTLISSQNFDGSFKLETTIAQLLNTTVDDIVQAGQNNSYAEQVWTTLIALAYMSLALAQLQTSWMLVAKKAEKWIHSQHLADEAACKMAAQEYVKVKLNM